MKPIQAFPERCPYLQERDNMLRYKLLDVPSCIFAVDLETGWVTTIGQMECDCCIPRGNSSQPVRISLLRIPDIESYKICLTIRPHKTRIGGAPCRVVFQAGCFPRERPTEQEVRRLRDVQCTESLNVGREQQNLILFKM